jgi:hypothetical protein
VTSETLAGAEGLVRMSRLQGERHGFQQTEAKTGKTTVAANPPKSLRMP